MKGTSIFNPSKKELAQLIKSIYDEITEQEFCRIEICKLTMDNKYKGIKETIITVATKDTEETEEVPKTSQNKATKHKYGEYKNVLLTEQEYETLANMDNGLKAIEYLSEYIAYKGYKAKSHYLAIRKWVFDAVREQEAKRNRFTLVDRAIQEQIKDSSIPDELLGNVDM